MARFVLDTHACVYALSMPKKLGRRARAVLKRVASGNDEAWIPAAVVAEICLLRELGRIGFGLPEIRTLFEEASSIRFLPLEFDQLDDFSSIGVIRDPFDRLIISAARTLRAKLITRDEEIQEAGLVQVVWS
jgi:PIN domain nuclease of toxin-antitoxin system